MEESRANQSANKSGKNPETMSSLAGKMGSGFDRFTSSMIYVSAIFIAIMTLSICADVIMRAAAGSPIGSLMEIDILLLVYIPFLAAAADLKLERHIKVDTLLIMFRPKTQAFITMVTSVLGIFIGIILLYFGAATTIDLFIHKVTTIESMQLPRWIYLVVVPLCGFTLIVQFIRRTILYFKSWKEGKMPVIAEGH